MQTERIPTPMPPRPEPNLTELLRQALEGFLPPTRATIALLDRMGDAA